MLRFLAADAVGLPSAPTPGRRVQRRATICAAYTFTQSPPFPFGGIERTVLELHDVLLLSPARLEVYGVFR